MHNVTYLLEFSKFSASTIAFLAFWLAKKLRLSNNYSMSPSWIWSYKITNELVARVGYNHFISKKGKWNSCFSKFSNRVLPPIFISTILQGAWKENLAHYFPYDVKLGLLAHSRSLLANQKARHAIVGAENLLKANSRSFTSYGKFSVFMRRNHIPKWNITYFSEVLVLSDERPYRNLTFHIVLAR